VRKLLLCALATVVAGCSTAPVKKVEQPQRWECTKVDGRGPTGENVECREVVTDPHGQPAYGDGPPVPSRALDPVPRPPRTGWNKFWYDYGPTIVALSLTGFMVWDVNYEFKKQN